MYVICKLWELLNRVEGMEAMEVARVVEMEAMEVARVVEMEAMEVEMVSTARIPRNGTS
jgi:hypothetical protein